MKYLDAHAQRFREFGGAVGDNHEFLHVDGVVGMGPAVDDIHHGDGQRAGVDAAQVAVERGSLRIGCSAGGGHRNGENRVGAEFGFVV